MDDTNSLVALAARGIQEDASKLGPPTEGRRPASERVVLFSLVRGTRSYIESVVNQINGCYENAWYDACCVMIRRLIETLIIEVYERHSLSDSIRRNDDYLMLGELVSCMLAEPTWNLSRTAKRALPKLKDIGDRSAHSRRFSAHRGDIDRYLDDIRVVVQELVVLAQLK